MFYRYDEMEVEVALVSDVLALKALQQNDTAWKLLHAQNAYIVISILDERLGAEVTKRTIPDMVNLVDADLETLRERIPGIGLERSARDYCELWRQAGYLVRKPLADTRQETYELSGGALAAITFAKGLARPHRTATKSRLNMILDQISDLSLATDSNVNRRKTMLLAEKSRIEEQLLQLEQGVFEIIKPEQALEQARDILNLAREIPRDFVNVSADFEKINKNLYAKLIGYDQGYQDTLEDVFAGVDHVSQSPAGQSFRGFYSLLRDSEASEKLQDDIDSILGTEFAEELEVEERRFLRRFVQALLDQSREVNETMTGLARGLRKLVQSQSFQQDRVLKRQLDQALSSASALTDAYRCTQLLPLELELTKTPIAPISRLELRNPADSEAEPISETVVEEGPVLSLAQLYEQVREVEIDFNELVDNVNACFVAKGKRTESAISIATVLEQFPASQGVASVVGLMLLAADQGIRTDDSEIVHWQSKSGIDRKALIEKIAFTEEVR